MHLRIHSLGRAMILAGVLVTAAPGSGHAAFASDEAADAASASLQAERRKLVADLARANAEIQQLKKKDRGVREDYRLRARMADAEAIARRLTEIDTKIGAGARPASPTAPRPAAPIGESAPTDGPAEWEARADILTDQSRRLEAEAAALSQRVAGVRNRTELRRRAGQLEADPFAPIEGSKRRLIVGLPSASPQTPGPSGADSTPKTASGGGTTAATGGRGDNSGGNNNLAPPGAMSAGGGTGAMTPPSTVAGGQPASTPTATPGAGTDSAPVGAQAAPRLPGPTPVAPAGTGPGGAGDNTSSLSAQLRDVLDPPALATIRKLEAAGTPSASVEAMERAAAALRERALRLQAQSNGLRERAKIAH